MPHPASPSATEIAEMSRLHALCRYPEAYAVFSRLSPPEAWDDPDALILAGRLMIGWGDWARSNRLHTRAWQRAPAHPPAIYYQGLVVEYRHGPFEALRFHRQNQELAVAAAPTPAHGWAWLHEARLRAMFRDFEASEALLHRAEAVVGTEPWWWVERSRVLEMQDRYPEALEATAHALQLHPRYRPALESRAHLLMVSNRDDEALALLQDAVAHLQIGNLAQLLAIHLGELERYAEVLPVLDLAEAWMPCAQRDQRRWLAGRRADALRRCGRQSEAVSFARAAENPFQTHVADRLTAAAATPAPVLLRVQFVRQHHLTCAPATLTALAHFWRQDVDHLALARRICYDGTPDHEERHWAEEQGWVVREFRVTWETAVALLDRGCPFTLTTVAPRNAHLQAVVGYDAGLGLLSIRDPFERTHGECVAHDFLTACASHGPRGMVFVPADHAARLDGIEFPDAAYYDAWYRLRRALAQHDRPTAQAAAEGLAALDPNHRVTRLAQRELASYDGNLLRVLDATRALLTLFPDDPNFRLDEIQLLRALGHTAEQRERTLDLVRRPRPDALYLREGAELLAGDARTHGRAQRLLRRALRRRAIDAGNLRALANLLWNQQHFAPATEVYRLAACVGDKVESYWDSYFAACRHLRTAEACVALLRQREARLGGQSGQPARTLFRALETLDQTPAAFAALAQALVRRPADGELLLFAAECHARYGQSAEAARLLAAAATLSPRPAWLKTAAQLAEISTDHSAALAHGRELLTLNPVDVDAHRAVARLLSALAGRPAALAFLQAATARHGSQIPLLTLYLEWLRLEPPAEALHVVDRVLAIDPENAWALREKAQILLRDHRPAEALTLAEQAVRIEPQSAYSPGTRAFVLSALGRTAEAHAEFMASLRLGLEPGLMSELVATAADFAGRSAAIAWLQAELVRQPVPGDLAFLRFRELARSVLSPAETQEVLAAVRAGHDGQWAAWSAFVTHLIEQDDPAAALTRAREAAERFPLSARTWLDLAAAQSRARETTGEIDSLRRALELSPGWGRAARELADAHERALDLDAAEHVLRRAVAADPLDAFTSGQLANLLWRRGQADEARTLIERTVTLDSSQDWAWNLLDQWSQPTADPGRAAALAEHLTRARPGDAQTWLRLARLQSTQVPTALATLARALALNPRDPEIHDFQAQLLAGAGRHDEALAACRPPVFGDTPPHLLLGRAAWVEHGRGHLDTAINQIRAVLEKHPDYTWGWARLTEWLWLNREDAAGTLPAANRWAWLSPNDATPLGYAAAALHRLGKVADAKATMWRALHRDPTYHFGAHSLLAWLTADAQLEEATRLLRHIETHFSPADRHRAAVLYHVLRKDRPAALEAFTALTRTSPARVSLLHECAQAFTEAGWRRDLEDALWPLLSEPGLSPELARLWVETWAPAKQWWKLDRLAAPAAPDAVCRVAWSTVLEHHGRARATLRLRWLRWRRGPWLRAHAETWGSFGYALLSARLSRAAIAWLADWKTRSELRPWMLYNLALAHYQSKQPDEAFTVVQHALTLPADHCRLDFQLWHGLESALRGQIPAAAESLAQTTSPSADPSHQLQRAFTQLIVDFESRLPQSRPAALQAARQQLDQAWSANPHAPADTMLVHFRARVLHYLGSRADSWITRVRSHVPPAGRRYVAPRASQNPLGEHWWAVWIVLWACAGLARNCSGH